MDAWILQNSRGKQAWLALGCAAIGLVLIVSCRNDVRVGTDSLAGFLLGVLLLFLGILAFLVGGKRTIVVDPKARCIVIEEKNRFGTKRRSIEFSDIADTHVSYIGKYPTYVYYLALKLRNGERYSLFPPGYFFDGGSDKAAMERRQLRLEGYLKR
jgi:hypothetical protein